MYRGLLYQESVPKYETLMYDWSVIIPSDVFNETEQ